MLLLLLLLFLSVGIDRHLLGLQLIAALEGDHTIFARDSDVIM